MGRNDLVDAGQDEAPDHGCPRQWVEPIEMIARAARDSRVVIVESERHAPAQSAFVQDLVTRLAGDGFTVFADDGLTLGPGGASHPEVMLVSEGLVTRDPAQGRLVREAKRHHMTLVDPGVWWTSPAELSSLSTDVERVRRQDALASQVARRIFARDPSARVIIHAERPSNAAESDAFKARVADLTGHMPLQIALLDCVADWADPAFLPSYGDGAGIRADLVFAIPQPQVKAGRVTSGREQAESLVSLPMAFLAKDKPVLVEARRVGDPDLAVPEDRLMLLPGDRMPLILPPGDYRIEAWTRSGPVAAPVTVEVT